MVAALRGRRFVGSRDGRVAKKTIMKERTASEFVLQPYLRTLVLRCPMSAAFQLHWCPDTGPLRGERVVAV